MAATVTGRRIEISFRLSPDENTVPASAFADDDERRAFEELVSRSVPGR